MKQAQDKSCPAFKSRYLIDIASISFQYSSLVHSAVCMCRPGLRYQVWSVTSHGQSVQAKLKKSQPAFPLVRGRCGPRFALPSGAPAKCDPGWVLTWYVDMLICWYVYMLIFCQGGDLLLLARLVLQLPRGLSVWRLSLLRVGGGWVLTSASHSLASLATISCNLSWQLKNCCQNSCRWRTTTVTLHFTDTRTSW